MNALNDLNNIIHLTNNIINCFNALSTPTSTKDELDNIEQLLNNRTKQLHRFFKEYTQQELANLTEQLNNLSQQDNELTQLACKIKKDMQQQIIKQKKTNKAHQAYKNT